MRPDKLVAEVVKFCQICRQIEPAAPVGWKHGKLEVDLFC